MRKFRLFCLCCDWTTVEVGDGKLWRTYARCPKCDKPTDAVEV